MIDSSTEQASSPAQVLDVSRIEKAAAINRDELFRFGVSLLLFVGIMLFTFVRAEEGTQGVLLVAAAIWR